MASLSDLKLDEPLSWKELFTKIGYLGNLSRAIRLVDPLLTLKVESAIESVLEGLPTDKQDRLKSVTLQLKTTFPEITEVQFQRLQKEFEEQSEFESKKGQEQYNYAHSFDHKDPYKYFKFMRQIADTAANTTAICAQTNVAYCYMNGYGTVQDEKLGFEMMLGASERGSLTATRNLGIYYAKGRGTKRDDKKAFETFLHGASRNCAVCQWFLSLCYHVGQGTTQNQNLSIEWSIRAAKNNYAAAIEWLKHRNISY